MTRADAENAVRRGQRTGFIVVKPGFGEASNRMFYGSPKEIEVGVDPARQAEAGMLEGLLMKHAAADMQKMFTDSQASTAMVDKALGDIEAGAARSGRAGAALSRRAEDLHGHAAVAGAAGIAAG